MTYESLSITRMGPYLGAEIGNIDLTKPLSEIQIRELRRAILDFSVIFFREQPLDIPALKTLGSLFGTLHIHSGMAGLPDHPDVTRIHADEKSERVNGEEWHTDLSCDPIPPMGSILLLHTLPPFGGDTIFASMYAAYDELSDRMKAMLEGLTATHDGYLVFGHRYPGRTYSHAVHPVIARHPETGRKLLYVNRGFTARINELPNDESRELLGLLCRHAEKADFQIRFKWRKNSIAFWDNRCTQHLAVWDYYPHVRSGYRVQIEGEQAVSA